MGSPVVCTYLQHHEMRCGSDRNPHSHIGLMGCPRRLLWVFPCWLVRLPAYTTSLSPVASTGWGTPGNARPSARHKHCTLWAKTPPALPASSRTLAPHDCLPERWVRQASEDGCPGSSSQGMASMCTSNDRKLLNLSRRASCLLVTARAFGPGRTTFAM